MIMYKELRSKDVGHHYDATEDAYERHTEEQMEVIAWWLQYGRNKQSGFYPDKRRDRTRAWRKAKRLGIDLLAVMDKFESGIPKIMTRPNGYSYDMPEEDLKNYDELRKGVYYLPWSDYCVFRNGMMYGWACGGLIPGRVRDLP